MKMIESCVSAKFDRPTTKKPATAVASIAKPMGTPSTIRIIMAAKAIRPMTLLSTDLRASSEPVALKRAAVSRIMTSTLSAGRFMDLVIVYSSSPTESVRVNSSNLKIVATSLST